MPMAKAAQGGGGLVIAVGPLAGLACAALEAMPVAQRPNLWALAELPLERQSIPARRMLRSE